MQDEANQTVSEILSMLSQEGKQQNAQAPPHGFIDQRPFEQMIPPESKHTNPLKLIGESQIY